MKKKELDRFRKLLLLERQAILQHMGDLEGLSNSALDQGGGDEVDIASLEISQTAIQRLGNREKNLLKKIELALNKIDSGEYGVCEGCGEDIAIPRLEARPVAQFCIDCKTEQEQNERRYSEEQNDADETSDGDELEDTGT